jgi:polysaccharide biosynthesis transport protein
LSGKAPLDDVLFRDSSGMDVLPLTAGTPVTPKIFEDASFDALMQRLRKQYEYIVLDTAPILAVTDTRMLLRQFDALALLVRWRSTPVRAVRAAVHQINAVGGDVTGIALTMVNLKTQAQSGHGDPSYYTGYMKDYYNAS